MANKPTLLDLIWGLPQHIVAGFLFLALCIGKKIDSIERLDNGVCVIRIRSFHGGVSLGWFVFVGVMAMPEVIMHESGHSCQSMTLGPLYLIIIGLPSFLFATIATIQGQAARRWYYRMYTEAWADKLGGVTRGIYL